MISIPLKCTRVMYSRTHFSWVVIEKEASEVLVGAVIAKCPTELDAFTFAIKYEDGASVCFDAECGKCIACKHTH